MDSIVANNDDVEKNSLQPGRDLDALVAEKVMGVKPKLIAIATQDGGKSAAVVEHWNGPFPDHNSVRDWIEEHPGYKLDFWKEYRPYSTDIAAAWKVIEKLCDAPDGDLPLQITFTRSNGWFVEIGDGVCSDQDIEGLSQAICLAALKAVGGL